MSSIMRLGALLLGAVYSVTAAPVEFDKRGTLLCLYGFDFITLIQNLEGNTELPHDCDLLFPIHYYPCLE